MEFQISPKQETEFHPSENNGSNPLEQFTETRLIIRVKFLLLHRRLGLDGFRLWVEVILTVRGDPSIIATLPVGKTLCGLGQPAVFPRLACGIGSSNWFAHSFFMTPPPLLDMAVIGAGPAGSTCAISALAATGEMSIALVDQATFPRDKACGDGVRLDAALLLKNLGLDEIFEDRPLIGDIRATVPEGFEYLQTIVEAENPDEPDARDYYIVERTVFDDFLCRSAIDKGAEDYTGHRFVQAEQSDSGEFWTLDLTDPFGATIQIRSRILIGADGAASRVRRITGQAKNSDVHMSVGLRAYADFEDFTENAMRFDMLKSLIPGYGWLFPLVNRRCNIGIGIAQSDYKLGKHKLEYFLDDYIQFLQAEGITIKNVTGIKNHPLPLYSQALSLLPTPGSALIGDAAAMISPLTGEGIHYGMWAGYLLGEAVGRCMNEGKMLQEGLDDYERAFGERFGESMRKCGALRDWIRIQRIFS